MLDLNFTVTFWKMTKNTHVRCIPLSGGKYLAGEAAVVLVVQQICRVFSNSSHLLICCTMRSPMTLADVLVLAFFGRNVKTYTRGERPGKGTLSVSCRFGHARVQRLAIFPREIPTWLLYMVCWIVYSLEGSAECFSAKAKEMALSPRTTMFA